MGQFRTNLSSALLIALLLSTSACVPKQGGASASDKASGPAASTMAITTVRVGPSAAYNAETYNGDYYSKYDPVVVNGTCTGGVQKVLVQDTPQGGSATTQTVTCNNGTFSWTKSYSVEKQYALVLTAQDSSGTNLSGVTPISKNYTYDVTNPVAPTFVSPSVTNNYTITNGNTSVTIVGQVPIDVVKMVGPFSLNLPLMVDPDGIHKDFTFNGNVPVSSTVNFLFTGSDAAGNSSSSTMTIDSILNLSIPVAAQEVGGSHTVSGGLIIEGTAGYMSDVTVNNNVKQATGSSGIMGNL